MPESDLPSLATSCEHMASHREQIMVKTQKFQIVYAGLTICAVEGTVFQTF